MSAFPEFDADSLSVLALAFRVRSKAISYHAPEWKISREVETEFERLNVDASGYHGELRLSVWADSLVWFRLCRGRAKDGWDFMLAFHGDRTDLNAENIVEQYISSMTSHTDTLLEAWQGVNPVVERHESSA